MKKRFWKRQRSYLRKQWASFKAESAEVVLAKCRRMQNDSPKRSWLDRGGGNSHSYSLALLKITYTCQNATKTDFMPTAASPAELSICMQYEWRPLKGKEIFIYRSCLWAEVFSDSKIPASEWALDPFLDASAPGWAGEKLTSGKDKCHEHRSARKETVKVNFKQMQLQLRWSLELNIRSFFHPFWRFWAGHKQKRNLLSLFSGKAGHNDLRVKGLHFCHFILLSEFNLLPHTTKYQRCSACRTKFCLWAALFPFR